MSVSALTSVASALTELQQQKAEAALKAERNLVAQPNGASAATANQLPQDTVSLSSAAHQASAATKDGDGDSH